MISHAPAVQSAASVADMLGDIQRLIVTSYTDRCARHLVLRVQDAEAARTFLQRLIASGMLTFADDDARTVAAPCDAGRRGRVNISVTFRGLEALQLDAGYLDVFRDRARAFSEGAWFRAASRLGDTGPAAPAHWEKEFGPERAHLLLTVHAQTEQEVDRTTIALQELHGAVDGLDGWTGPTFDARHLDDKPAQRRVHFGYRDGLTRLRIRGVAYAPKGDATADAEHAAGEFLLGHDNDEDFNAWLFAGNAPGQALGEFFRNGSFGVFRKIEQDEPAFRSFVQQAASAMGVDRGLVMAKLCGRWPESGAVVSEASPSADAGDAGAAFDFTTDVHGIGCPFGAHIRRMNPRADAVVPFRRRPLMRRGMPYGIPHATDPGATRGLMGMFICVSIEDQFEHLVGQWANSNPLGAPNRGNAKDPFVASAVDPTSVFDLPGQKAPLKSMRPFVLTKGTLYTFFPSLTALRKIAGPRERGGQTPADCPICGQALHADGH